MTMPHAEVVRKVKQLDDDMHAVYELIDKVRATQTEHTRRLDVLDAKADEHGVKLDEHGVKLDEHGVKLDRIIDLLSER